MFNLDCSHLSIFLYFYLIIEHMDRIERELDTSTKEKNWLGRGGDTSLTKPQTPAFALHSLYSLFV